MKDRSAELHAVVVGKVIARLRNRVGIGQVALSRRVGITQPTMSRLERGHASPDPFVLRSLAGALCVRPAVLCQLIEDSYQCFQETVARLVPRGAQVSASSIADLAGVASLAVAKVLTAAAIPEGKPDEQPQQ